MLQWPERGISLVYIRNFILGYKKIGTEWCWECTPFLPSPPPENDWIFMLSSVVFSPFLIRRFYLRWNRSQSSHHGEYQLWFLDYVSLWNWKVKNSLSYHQILHSIQEKEKWGIGKKVCLILIVDFTDSRNWSSMLLPLLII